MNSILAIAMHELRRLSKSPSAWVVLAIIQFIAAIYFYNLLGSFNATNSSTQKLGITHAVVVSHIYTMGIILLFISPLLTMQIFSEEYRTGTIRFLYASPVSSTELVLGKFIGMSLWHMGIVLLIALMPLSLMFFTPLYWERFAVALLAILLLVNAATAVGLFVSCLSKNTILVAIGSFAILVILSTISVGSSASPDMATLFNYLSLLQHYHKLTSGLLSSVSVIYYLLLTSGCLSLCIWRLDLRRIYG